MAEMQDAPVLDDFISLSQPMKQLMTLVQRVVPSDVSLLILGETGVGKEHLARGIHAAGPRAAEPFVPVNCGAIPENLLESELFGHEAGAFTGATRRRRGMFSLAHRGTLFLDEIGEMPYHLQVKLLRALQSNEIMPVGGEEVLEVDVRVMAASNRDLAREVKEKRFRRDLFYRLSVLPLTIPPLRERAEDIPVLAKRFLAQFSAADRQQVSAFEAEALEALARHRWPGNVRELMNVIERAVLVSRGEALGVEDLPEAISWEEVGEGQVSTPERSDEGLNGIEEAGSFVGEGLPAAAPVAVAEPEDDGLLARPLREVRREVVEDLERRYLDAMLRATGGRVGETARRAGIVPRSLYEKMRKYGLHKEDYR